MVSRRTYFRMKDIVGYEGLYAIEEDGRVWSYKYKKYLAPDNSNGYNRVTLKKNKIKTKYFIHRLIAIIYIPNPDNKPNIDHINRNKLDNRIENLRWVTQAENRHNSTINRNNTSGYSNITIDKSRNSYVFYIRRNDYRFSKYFKTLEEAVAYRDDYLSKV